MVIGPEHATAQLTASIEFADGSAGASAIVLYATDPPSGAAVATIELAKPCATLNAGALTLHPANPAGSLVMLNATPRSAQWLRSDGMLVAQGTVTDASNGGDFTISGGVTAPGETSPSLYAGGLVLLGAVILT